MHSYVHRISGSSTLLQLRRLSRNAELAAMIALRMGGGIKVFPLALRSCLYGLYVRHEISSGFASVPVWCPIVMSPTKLRP